MISLVIKTIQPIHVDANATSFDPVTDRDKSLLRARTSEIEYLMSPRSHLKLVTDVQERQRNDSTEYRAQSLTPALTPAFQCFGQAATLDSSIRQSVF